MNCKPSSSKTISLLSRKQNKRHDKEMNEFKDKLIKNKLKQTASKKKSVRVEGKEKEKEEALVKKALVKGKKNKGSKRKLPADTKNKEKPVNKPLSATKIIKKAKDQLYKIEKIIDHKYGLGKKKNVITMLLIKWEGWKQTTWEPLSDTNETASGMVKEYIKSKKLTVLKNTK